MGKSVKIISSAIAVIIFLTIITIITLPFIINPNNFKPEIITAVKNKTGRDIKLTDDLKLSIFPWLGLSTGKLTLSNPVGFEEEPFLSLEESDIKVKLLPLLSKKIEVNQIIIKGLILNLTKNLTGINNWNDLTSSGTQKINPLKSISQNNHQEATDTIAISTINGITIENAVINWNNQKSGNKLLIKDVNFITNKFAYNEPVFVDLSLDVINPDTNWLESIKLKTELILNEKLERLELNRSDLHLTILDKKNPNQPHTATFNAANIALNKPEQTLNVSGLEIRSKDVLLSADITGNTINGNTTFQGPLTIAPFSPTKVLKQLGISTPIMQDTEALNKAAATFNFVATSNSCDLQNITLSLDDTKILGSTSVTDFNHPAIAFNLAADAMDADRYLPPVIDKSSQSLATPAIALALGVSTIPIETLRKLNILGQLSLSKFKVKGMALQGVQLNLKAKDGLIAIQPSINKFYTGSYSGNINADMRNNNSIFALNEKVSHVQVEPLLKDFNGAAKIGGLLDASLQLEGQGSEVKELKSSFTGNLSFLFKDSVIKGFNLQKIINDAKTFITKSNLPINNKNEQTLFSNISGTAMINKGLIQNNDMVAKSSKIQINGKGNADLNTEKLDYKINANLIKTAATATEPEQLNDTPINITVAGTFSKPTYAVDLAALLTDKNKAKIEKFIDKNHEKIDEIANKIDKKIGPKVGNFLKGLFKKNKE